MMKNSCQIFLRKIFTFLSRLFAYAEKQPDNKVRVMMSKTGIHDLLNILRAEDNQAMKFSKLIKYKMRTIVPKKLYKKYSEQASPRLFYENSRLNIFFYQQPKML